MGVVLDTSYLVDVERHVGDANALPANTRMLVCAVSVAELLLGLELADEARRTRRESFIEGTLARVTVLDFDLPAARRYAAIVATLRRAGLPIGDRDAMIAATALAHGHSVMTLNKGEFERVAGLQVLSPP